MVEHGRGCFTQSENGGGVSFEEPPRLLKHVVVGGESGPHARPCDVAWIRDLVLQCGEAGAPLFLKQLGRWIAGDETGFLPATYLLSDAAVFVPGLYSTRPASAVAFSLRDRAGADPAEWPADLRVRELPR